MARGLGASAGAVGLCRERAKIFRSISHMAAGRKLLTFEIGPQSTGLAVKDGRQRLVIEKRLNDLPNCSTWPEPFGRNREAIEEAQQAVR